MTKRDDAPSLATALQIRQAAESDLPEIVAIFDRAVAWLVAKGLAGQWGTVPFSQNPAMIERFRTWIREGAFFVAGGEEGISGTIVLSSAPPSYAAEICARYPAPALYLEALATDRARPRQGIGAALLRFAEERAAERDVEWLQLDCWAGNDRLRHYYRDAGFHECEIFGVGNWQGVLFQKQVIAARLSTD